MKKKPVKASLMKRLITQLRRDGKSPEAAGAIAAFKMRKAGNLGKGNKLTAKGKKREQLGAAGRAKSRAAKKHGRKPSEYKYSATANRATMKKPTQASKNASKQGRDPKKQIGTWKHKGEKKK
jgi:hypothetical protein